MGHFLADFFFFFKFKKKKKNSALVPTFVNLLKVHNIAMWNFRKIIFGILIRWPSFYGPHWHLFKKFFWKLAVQIPQEQYPRWNWLSEGDLGSIRSSHIIEQNLQPICQELGQSDFSLHPWENVDEYRFIHWLKIGTSNRTNISSSLKYSWYWYGCSLVAFFFPPCTWSFKSFFCFFV